MIRARCLSGGCDQVVRNREDHWYLRLERVGDGLIDRAGDVCEAERECAHADSGRVHGLVDVPGAWAGARLISHDDEHRGVGLRGFGEGGEGVGESGTIGRRGDCDLATHAGVGVGCCNGRRLVAHRGVWDADPAEVIDEVRIAVAHEAEAAISVLGKRVSESLREGRCQRLKR